MAGLPKIPGATWINLLEEFGASLGADIVSRLIFGRVADPADAAAIEKAKTLISEGKKDEAEAILMARPGGVDQEDEQILMNDLLALLRGGLVNQAQALALTQYLAGLSDQQRRLFRLAHTKEPNHTIRYGNLVELALLNNDADRASFLQGAGMFEPNPLEESFRMLEQRARASNLATQTSIDARLARLRALRPRPTVWQRISSIFNFNPLR
ncbi:MAG: hypothetical protein Q8P83_04005 [bacterium]|nr:hypothetical protein [bacterium]